MGRATSTLYPPSDTSQWARVEEASQGPGMSRYRWPLLPKLSRVLPTQVLVPLPSHVQFQSLLWHTPGRLANIILPCLPVWLVALHCFAAECLAERKIDSLLLIPQLQVLLKTEGCSPWISNYFPMGLQGLAHWFITQPYLMTGPLDSKNGLPIQSFLAIGPSS